jgi:hypothetical protein
LFLAQVLLSFSVSLFYSEGKRTGAPESRPVSELKRRKMTPQNQQDSSESDDIPDTLVAQIVATITDPNHASGPTVGLSPYSVSL